MPTRPRHNLAAYLAGFAAPLPAAVLPGTVRQPAARRPGEAADGDGATDLPTLLARVPAAGYGPGVTAALGRLWPSLTARDRSQVAAPLRPGRGGLVRLGGAAAVQTSPTTCGSASLVLLAAAGDPVLATWLVTGQDLGVPPAGALLPGFAPGPGAEAPDAAGERFAALQGAMQRATCRRALGPFPWPGRFGTPPWTAARHARFPGVRYSHRPVDDADRVGMTRLLSWVRASVVRGVPVPLYTGGDRGRGLASAVPRHVVLAVPGAPEADPEALFLYEPGTARVFTVPAADLVARTTPHPALGNWTHVCWAVLPRRGAAATVIP